MINFRKLWVRLAERELKKMDLVNGTGIGRSTLAKLSKNEYVALKVLEDICLFLECDIGDILEILPNSEKIEKEQD